MERKEERRRGEKSISIEYYMFLLYLDTPVTGQVEVGDVGEE